MKKRNLWAIKDFRGSLLLYTVRPFRGEAVKAWLNLWDENSGKHNWPLWYRKGWRATRVQISEVP